MFLLGTSRQWLSWLSEQFLCCLPFHPITVVLIVHLTDLQIVLHQLVLKQKPSLKSGPRSHFINLHPALGKMFNIERKCLICMIHLDMYESRRTVHRLIINLVVNYTLDKMLSVIPRLWSFQESKCCFVQKNRKRIETGDYLEETRWENLYILSVILTDFSKFKSASVNTVILYFNHAGVVWI